MFRSAITGACTGLAIALLVLRYPYLEQHFGAPIMDERLMFWICPPSLVLLGIAGGSSLWVFIILCAMVVVFNSAWHSFWFMMATLPFTKSARRKQRLNSK
jgi:hypothetical protein